MLPTARHCRSPRSHSAGRDRCIRRSPDGRAARRRRATARRLPLPARSRRYSVPFHEVELIVQSGVEWLRLLIETLGALVIGVGMLITVLGLARHATRARQQLHADPAFVRALPHPRARAAARCRHPLDRHRAHLGSHRQARGHRRDPDGAQLLPQPRDEGRALERGSRAASPPGARRARALTRGLLRTRHGSASTPLRWQRPDLLGTGVLARRARLPLRPRPRAHRRPARLRQVERARHRGLDRRRPEGDRPAFGARLILLEPSGKISVLKRG